MIEPSTTPPPYWFPAKTYGWGWGLPVTWQGWVVMAVFVALMLVGAVVLLPSYGHPVFLAYSLVLCAVLVGVCWFKGEPPRWHWGDSDR